MTEITVPTLGESVSEATVGEWQVSEGDAVKKDDILVELETDKVSVEVRAEEDGVISKIVAQEGDTVEIGATLAEMGEGGGASAAVTYYYYYYLAASPAPRPSNITTTRSSATG